MNDDARSPGAGSTPGPLSQQPPVLDTSDPGKSITFNYQIHGIILKNIRKSKENTETCFEITTRKWNLA